MTLSRGQRLRDVVIKLMPQAFITGRIVDEDNEPMANVTVQTLRYSYVQGKRQMVPASSEQSNDLGEYRIHGLSAGKYYVIAIGRNRLPEESYPSVYYPSTNDPATAVPLDVAAGSEIRGIDMTLHSAHTVRVRGKIPDLPRGTPVRIMPRNPSFSNIDAGRMAQIASQEGEFEFRGVTPGSYLLLVDFQENGKNRSVRQPLEVGNSGVDGVTITIPPSAKIDGQIRVDGQGGISLGSLSISMQLRDPTPPRARNTHANVDGSFGIENLSPDSYEVNISELPAGYYLKSARLGNQDVLESGLTIVGGTAKLDLVVSPAGGQVEGVVTDAKQQPAKAATVVLIPEVRRQSRLSLFQTTNTDQNGHYSIQGIAPGDYTIYAFEDLPPGAFQDPEFMKSFEKSAQSLTVQEGGHESKQLQQIQADDTTF